MRIEIRSNGSMHISGYVNAVCRDSRPIITPRGKVVEQIEAGVFGKAVERAQNIELRLNHDPNRVLASTKDKTLTLYEDSIGLRAECDITDPEVIKKAKGKELRGWSFGAYMTKDEIEERAGTIPRRHVREMELFEVSIIDNRKNPCYVGTSIEQRAEEEIIIEERSMESEARMVESNNVVDYAAYENRIKQLEVDC